MQPRTLFVFGFLGISFAVAPLAAQRDFSNVQINTIPVSDGVYMLRGSGGNIGLSDRKSVV